MRTDAAVPLTCLCLGIPRRDVKAADWRKVYQNRGRGATPFCRRRRCGGDSTVKSVKNVNGLFVGFALLGVLPPALRATPLSEGGLSKNGGMGERHGGRGPTSFLRTPPEKI